MLRLDGERARARVECSTSVLVHAAVVGASTTSTSNPDLRAMEVAIISWREILSGGCSSEWRGAMTEEAESMEEEEEMLAVMSGSCDETGIGTAPDADGGWGGGAGGGGAGGCSRRAAPERTSGGKGGCCIPIDSVVAFASSCSRRPSDAARTSSIVHSATIFATSYSTQKSGLASSSAASRHMSSGWSVCPRSSDCTQPVCGPDRRDERWVGAVCGILRPTTMTCEASSDDAPRFCCESCPRRAPGPR